jgi:alpha-ketoglutarate-dependent taurine dioxygenase
MDGRKIWEELDPELKEYLKTLKVINGHIANAYTEHNTGYSRVSGTGTLIFYENRQPVVYTNRRGVTSLDFPFLQVHHFVNFPIKESEELKERLTKIMLQEKYMYHHDWQDGDVVISDQYMGLHKRWEFEGMETRLLHRIAGNYDNTPL